MHAKRALAALVTMAVVASAMPLAQAGGHMSLYVLTPEHDDAGRSDEPNFAGLTSILGLSVAERTVDANLDGVGEPLGVAGDVAPGCTNDAGKQTSGLCFLALQTGGVVGVPGMSGNAVPGDFQENKGTTIRIMDLQSTFQAVRAYVEVNKKLDDSGLRGVLRTADSNFGNQLMMPANGPTMWFGQYTDKNGNGVIDAEGSGDFNAAQRARNELTWEGQCKTFTGSPSAVPTWVCQVVEPSVVYVWAYPGNHHASTNGGTAVFSPADVPGQQALCFGFIISVVGPIVQNAAIQNTGASAVGCPSRIQDIEENDDTLETGTGDPLLGEQGSGRPDFTMAHRTGDPNPNTRHMVAGLGWAMYHYDQSVLVSYTTVASLNPPVDGSGRLYNPNLGQMVDVDRYATLSPLAENLLTATVKPAARTQWVSFRDGYIPTNNLIEGKANSHTTGIGVVYPVQGPLDDLLTDPGFSHEPNHAQDSYPFVVRGAPGHAGFNHSYAGYQSLRLDGVGHLFGDGQLFRTAPLIRPKEPTNSLPPPPLPAGPFITDSISPTPARTSGDHRRSLGPGMYDFLGGLGAWQDKTQVNVDEVLGSPTVTYVSAPDGWVGNVINTTGQFRYRDYPSAQTCTVNGVFRTTYEWAHCHPYADGTLSQPNDFGTDDGEMVIGCGNVGSPVGTLEVIPVSGTWTFPTFVYRNIEEMAIGNTADLEDFTGRSAPIRLNIACAQASIVSARDYLVLPSGNAGGAVLTKWTASSSTVSGETIVDVDVYAPFA